MKRKVLIGVWVLVAAIIGVGAYVFTTLDDQDEAKVVDVVAEFRASKQPDQPARDGLPKQGVYRYTVTGKERIKRGMEINRTLPANAVALVRHQSGGYEMETRFSEQHIELARFDLTSRGAYLTRAVTTVVAGPIKTVRDREWKPKLLRFPAANAKREWGGDYEAGDLKLNVKARFLPDEKVTVGGTPVDVKVAEFVQDVTGDYTGDRTETFWYSPKMGLIIRYKIVSSLKGPTDIDFSADQALASLEPEV
jgi:hypothetical protein